MTKPLISKKLNTLSVFFPCFNEEENLPVLLDSAIKVISNIANTFEVIVINDGSTDNTSKIAHEYASKFDFIRVIDQENQGYGGAVNTGFVVSKYEWVFFTDSDLQFDLEEIYTFVERALYDDVDLVIGYRKKRAEGFVRKTLANGMKLYNRTLLGFPTIIKDIDCAFKLIKKDVVNDFMPLISKGNLVTTEFLLKSYKSGYKIDQIGVNHYNRVAGESTCGGFDSVVKVVIESFKLLLKLKAYNVKIASQKLLTSH